MGLPILCLAMIWISISCDSKKSTESIENPESMSWDDFQYPVVDFKIEPPDGQARDFKKYVPDLEQLIRKRALSVSKLLYEHPHEVPGVDTIKYTVCEFEGLSGKGGQRPVIEFTFGSQYFASLLDSVPTEQRIHDEIIGVMVHEMTHAYQKDCKYESDGWSVIEGIADAVRYLEGYVDKSREKPGGSWQDGYKKTGFFIVWIMQQKDKDFIKKLNRSLGENYDWKWDENIRKLTGQSVDSLWQEYQQYLQSGSSAQTAS